MIQSITYEWVTEEIDRNSGDIIDLNHSVPFPGFPKADQDTGLVRNDWRRANVERSWAYLENGKLPEYFTDAMGVTTAKVPAKFHKEVAKAAGVVMICGKPAKGLAWERRYQPEGE